MSKIHFPKALIWDHDPDREGTACGYGGNLPMASRSDRVTCKRCLTQIRKHGVRINFKERKQDD